MLLVVQFQMQEKFLGTKQTSFIHLSSFAQCQVVFREHQSVLLPLTDVSIGALPELEFSRRYRISSVAGVGQYSARPFCEVFSQHTLVDCW